MRLRTLSIILLALSSFIGRGIAQGLNGPPEKETSAAKEESQGIFNWTLIPTPSHVTMGYIGHTESDTVWIGGNDILRSTDKGFTWNRFNVPPSGAALVFYNSRLGYLGSGNRIYVTRNGGSSWDSANSGSNDMHAMCAPSVDTAYATYLSNIMRTTDQGRSWTLRQTGGFINWIAFADRLHGIVVGSQTDVTIDSPMVAFVLTTSDGGENWYPSYSGLQYDLAQVAMPNDSICYAASLRGYIAKSTNGGRSWKDTLAAPLHYGFAAVAARGKTVAAVGANGKILISTNEGVTWIEELSVTPQVLWSVAFLDDRTIIAGGDSGTLVRTTTRQNSVAPSPVIIQTRDLGVFPNPSTNQIKVQFDLPLTQQVTVCLYSSSGLLVSTPIHNQPFQTGQHTIYFNANVLPSGEYMVELTSQKYRMQGHLELIK